MAHHGISALHQVKERGIFMWSNRVALKAWICLASILGCPDGVAQQVVPMQIVKDCGMSMHSAGDSPARRNSASTALWLDSMGL